MQQRWPNANAQGRGHERVGRKGGDIAFEEGSYSMIGSRYFVSGVLLLLLGRFGLSEQDNNETSPISVREFPARRRQINDTLVANTVHVYYLKLDETFILDLTRISADVSEPALFRKEVDTILEVTVSNGRDNFILKLPMIYPDLTLYSYGKLLNPLRKEDFGPKRSKKNIPSENSTLSQNLVITVQSRLRVDIDYQLHLTRLDRSQYNLSFKEGQSTKTLNNQKLTFVKPIGFFLDTEEQIVKSFHITLTSADDICANVITAPANESIYERPVDSDRADNRRVLTFTRRADIFFSETEIQLFKTFRIFVFISPVNAPCSGNTSRKNYNEIKKITFDFTRLEPNSYFVPTLAMLVFFASPCLIFIASLTVNVIRNRSDLVADLISFSSDQSANTSAIAENNMAHNEIAVIPEEENLQVQEIEPIPIKQDSLSLHGQMFKYPVALILPVLMHTGVEFHNFTTSTMANRDEMCFHNNACAKPLGELRSWNNMISNIGYAIYGLVFIMVTMCRRWRHHSPLVGTYECTLLDITIGLFMILQAIASATYHICPSDIAFQFDTPCIQVICGLLIIRQWLVRQESPSPAYTNILLFCVVSLNFLISACSKASGIRYLIAIIHFGVVATVCLAKRKTLRSKQVYKVFVGTFAIFNFFAITIYVTSSYIHLNQISTYCFILNCILYLTYYALMKFASRESIELKAKVCGVSAIFGWLIAGFFFFQDDTDWTRTAAMSRALNTPCLLLDFFGSHDLWHMFGAIAVVLHT
ncbi:hypothetical protein L3Y34_007552 [Caenorhabditis briggsae]|uniref:Protein CBR-SID-1 n=1 Tax=Caenorhabditis briggsae TaxID=6238 RepID=A0AAE9CZ18_CAEBR|nr:hypothetical protein L3Y34_007552 [Caenorhabditis briggsae]